MAHSEQPSAPEPAWKRHLHLWFSIWGTAFLVFLMVVISRQGLDAHQTERQLLLGQRQRDPIPVSLAASRAPRGDAVAREAIASADPAQFSDRDRHLWSLVDQADIVSLGQEIYQGLCQACHGSLNSQGSVATAASNLFDAAWYHGSTPTAIERLIRVGYLDAGMPAWEPFILPDEDLEAVTAYLLSFQERPALP